MNYLQEFPKYCEICEYLEYLGAEFFFCDDYDQLISSCSYVFHYQTQKEDETCM